MERETKAQTKADEIAVKEAQKKQSEVLKKNEKKSLVVILSYKKASSSSAKAVTFAKQVEVVLEEKGSEITETRTRKINLPQRFRYW